MHALIFFKAFYCRYNREIKIKNTNLITNMIIGIPITKLMIALYKHRSNFIVN